MEIALDSVNAGGTGTGTSLTYSHTCTGSNLILFVAISVLTVGVDDLTTVTYNSVAMTQVGKKNTNAGGDNRWVYLYYLVNPSTGANNIVISSTSSTQTTSNAVSYTGAKQTGVPDASATNSTTGSTSLTGTVTSIADNCWTVGAIRGSGGALSASGGTTIRGTISSFNKICDSNGAITPAGSTSLGYTCTSGDNAIVIASFAPYVAATTSANFFTLLGVGT